METQIHNNSSRKLQEKKQQRMEETQAIDAMEKEEGLRLKDRMLYKKQFKVFADKM